MVLNNEGNRIDVEMTNGTVRDEAQERRLIETQ